MDLENSFPPGFSSDANQLPSPPPFSERESKLKGLLIVIKTVGSRNSLLRKGCITSSIKRLTLLHGPHCGSSPWPFSWSRRESSKHRKLCPLPQGSPVQIHPKSYHQTIPQAPWPALSPRQNDCIHQIVWIIRWPGDITANSHKTLNQNKQTTLWLWIQPLSGSNHNSAVWWTRHPIFYLLPLLLATVTTSQHCRNIQEIHQQRKGQD